MYILLCCAHACTPCTYIGTILDKRMQRAHKIQGESSMKLDELMSISPGRELSVHVNMFNYNVMQQ